MALLYHCLSDPSIMRADRRKGTFPQVTRPDHVCDRERSIILRITQDFAKFQGVLLGFVSATREFA